MKQYERLSDEIPVTREGLEIYISEMKKIFRPVQTQYNRMNDLLTEAKLRLSKMKGA